MPKSHQLLSYNYPKNFNKKLNNSDFKRQTYSGIGLKGIGPTKSSNHVIQTHLIVRRQINMPEDSHSLMTVTISSEISNTAHVMCRNITYKFIRPS